MVRNALFARVRLAALDRTRELGNLDEEWGFGERAWNAALDDYFAEHNEIRLDGDARSAAYLMIDESPEAEAHRVARPPDLPGRGRRRRLPHRSRR